MKKLIVILCVAALVLPATAALAGPNDQWVVQMQALDQNGANATATCQFGTRTNGADGSDSTDIALAVFGPNSVGITNYDIGPGGPGHGYNIEYKAPFELGQTKIWGKLYIRAGSNFIGTRVQLRAWNPTGVWDIKPGTFVRLQVVNDPTGTYAPNTILWTWNPALNGTGSAPAYTVWFNNPQVLKGVPASDGIHLRMIAAIPEPGSLVALLSGLVGLAGYAVRRRK